MRTSTREMMNTREVADYLRIKERKVYDLIKAGRIPCSRVTGKWLFPKRLIDRWVEAAATMRDDAARDRPAPPVIAGSHDPFLDWCLGESGSGLAMLAGGSLDGLRRLAAGEAMVAGMHVREAEGAGYNVSLVKERLAGLGVVVIEWAWREQGLVLAPGNPLAIRGIADLAARRARVMARQDEAGSQLLLVQLLAEAGLDLGDLDLVAGPARSETELALAVLEGKADAGLAVAAVARRLRLEFLPLARERYDLVMRRRDYFEPPVQRLMAFARTEQAAARAAALGGYDCAGLGAIVYNAP